MPSRSAPVAPPEPAVTGPSFLGLNKPADGQRNLHAQHGRSGSVDYLLEDDEEPRSRWGKWVVVLIALVLIGAFGYLHWRQGGFDWVLNGKKAAPAEASPAASAPNSTSSPAASDSAGSNTAPASNTPSSNPANPGASDSAGSTAPTASTAATPANAQPVAPAAGPTNPAPAPDNSAATPTTPAAEKAPAVSADDSSANSEAEETTKPAPSKAARKPTPATPLNTSAEAERYIYGRGVPQDCDRGLRLLKSAAQSDPKAMTTMGVLYSSGTCAPRDLPTAYRWFALALRKQPDNQALQDDLQQLWGKMTQPERQLAIKLSQ